MNINITIFWNAQLWILVDRYKLAQSQIWEGLNLMRPSAFTDFHMPTCRAVQQGKTTYAESIIKAMGRTEAWDFSFPINKRPAISLHTNAGAVLVVYSEHWIGESTVVVAPGFQCGLLTLSSHDTLYCQRRDWYLVHYTRSLYVLITYMVVVTMCNKSFKF
jgi:hypothetical protein